MNQVSDTESDLDSAAADPPPYPPNCWQVITYPP